MTVPSNLYAEKVFAEHPLALWSLDEDLDYLSKITNTRRNMNNWSVVSGRSTVDFSVQSTTPTDLIGNPFPEISAYKLRSIKRPTVPKNQTLSVMEAGAISHTSLNPDMKTITISFYTKVLHSYTTGVEIGYYTQNPSNANDLVFGSVERFSPPMPNEWSMYSATFDLPFNSRNLKIFLSFNYADQAANNGTDPSPGYDFIITGLTAGQWSEEFSATSLGIESISAFSDPSVLMAEGYVPAYQYGLGQNDSRYIVSNNRLLAKNTSIPMVYGSSSLTKIIPNPANIVFTNPPANVIPLPNMAYPSLMFPSLGMLRNEGRYNVYTFESWLRVDNRSYVSRKIIGPMFSADGIYVDGPFLKLNIGGNVGSHFIGEWYRPMLIHLRIGIDSASLLINGEQVMSISFETASLAFPVGPFTDEWGIFAYPDVPVIEVDCPAIYSYLVPVAVAKRRFGYGQAVESPDGVNKAFGAVTAFVDYSVADYTNNYQYPDIGNWGQGISENVNTEGSTLSSPRHNLPEFVFSNSDYENWLTDQSSNTGEFFTFATKPGFVRFNDLSVTNQATKGLYSIIEISSFPTSEQNLIKVVDKTSNDYVRFALVGDLIKCYIKVRGTETLFAEQNGVVLNQKIFVGMSFDRLASEFGGDVQAFFSRTRQLSLTVAGDSSFQNMFSGKIYKVGICTERNLNKILEFFNIEASAGEVDGGLSNTILWVYSIDGGTPESFDLSEVFDHIATYTLQASIRYNNYSIGIASDSYWQDYLPLSYFAQYVTNIFGQPYIDLDFIQFNVDYPVIPVYSGSEYDTSQSIVKTYVSFQLLAEGATKQLSAFTNLLGAPASNVISIEDSSWMNTAYQLVDGTVIYPPKDVPLNSLAIVTHIEMQTKDSVNDVVNIKRMEYSSQAFNSDTANPIGTKFNVSIYPYQKYASLFEYKSKNPYRIYKGSTPHLYLSKKTGLQKLGDYDPLISRGFLIPVNDKAAENYRVIAAQMFVYYDSDRFPADQIKVIELQSESEFIKVYLRTVDSSGQRALLYAINAKTGALYDGIAFYINGKIVKDPVITVNEWAVVGFRFANPMLFDNAVGAIRFTGPLLANNISYYESSSLLEVERQSFRLWDALTAADWSDWLQTLNRSGQSYRWQDVLVVASTRFAGISPSDIFKAYTGTSKIIGDDGAIFYIGGTLFETNMGISWSTSVVKPL